MANIIYGTGRHLLVKIFSMDIPRGRITTITTNSGINLWRFNSHGNEILMNVLLFCLDLDMRLMHTLAVMYVYVLYMKIYRCHVLSCSCGVLALDRDALSQLRLPDLEHDLAAHKHCRARRDEEYHAW